MIVDRQRYPTVSRVFLDFSTVGVGNGVRQLELFSQFFPRSIPTVASMDRPLKTITVLDRGDDVITSATDGAVEEVTAPMAAGDVTNQNQKGVLLRPQAMHRNVSPVLIFETLVKLVCRFCVEDKAQQESLFSVICQQMYRMQLLPHINEDIINPLRGQYLVAFEGLLNAAKIAVQNNDESMFKLAAADCFFSGASYQLPLGEEGLLKFQMCMYQHSRYRTEFEQISKIGSGGGGTVFKARYKLDSTVYAIKKIPIKFKNTPGDKFEQIIREALVLAKLNHPNIVNYKTAWIDYCTDPDCQCTSSSEDSSQSSSSRNLESASNFAKSTVNGSLIAERGDLTPNPLKVTDTEESESILFDDAVPYDGIVELGTSCKENDLVVKMPPLPKLPEIEVTTDDQVCTNEVRRSLLMRKRSLSYDDQVCIKLDMALIDKAKERKKSLSTEAKSNMCVAPLSLKTLAVKSNHPQCIQPYASFPLSVQESLIPKCQDVLVIQMELCSITLRDWLDERNSVLWDHAGINPLSIVNARVILNLFKQILEGVKYFHSQGILHRDLKPKNILFNVDRSQLKVGDFGLATYEEQTKAVVSSLGGAHTTNIGTKLYAAPEQISSSHYDSKADIYSLGIILYEMLNPFKTEMERSDCIRKLKEGRLALEEMAQWSELGQLISNMTSIDPCTRPTAQEILELPTFLTTYPWDPATPQESVTPSITEAVLPSSPQAAEEQLSPRLLEEKLRIKCAENEYLKRQLERMDHKSRKYRYDKEVELEALRAASIHQKQDYECQLHQKDTEIEALKRTCIEFQRMLNYRRAENRRLHSRNRQPSSYE